VRPISTMLTTLLTFARHSWPRPGEWGLSRSAATKADYGRRDSSGVAKWPTHPLGRHKPFFFKRLVAVTLSATCGQLETRVADWLGIVLRNCLVRLLLRQSAMGA
jgi:hypothetical protein